MGSMQRGPDLGDHGPVDWVAMPGARFDRFEGGGISRSTGLDLAPVSFVDFVHSAEVGHIGEEDVDLDDLIDVRAGSFEHDGEVLDALVRACCYVALDELAGCGIHGHLAAAEHEAVGNDGLAVDAGQRLGGLVRQDRLFGRHVWRIRLSIFCLTCEVTESDRSDRSDS